MRKRQISGGLFGPGNRTTLRVTKTASKEYLTSMFQIESSGDRTAYGSISDFADDFFTCRIDIPVEYDSGDYIIESRAAADLIKRPAPLSLLDPFLTSEITETPWVGLGD